ncbi:MAG: tetratricopeptide repeat protein, partial [Thermoleophilia bacterium]|nr:tetratricopeptide repeat protein [Thermoleophilia bacterium]
AAGVLPDGACDPRLEVDLGWSRFQAGEGPERVLSGFLDAAQRAARAGDHAGELALRVDHAAYELVYEGTTAAADRARALADDARQVFEASGDDWGLSVVYSTILMAQETQAQPWADILATAERIVTHARRAGADMIARFGENNYVAAQQEGATPVNECLRWLDEHPHLERQSVLPLRSRFLAMLGRFDEARELQARSAERLAELGSIRGPLILALRRYYVSMLEGDYLLAEAAGREMCERVLATGELGNFLEFSSMLALALLALGRDEEADEWLERAQAAAPTGAVNPRVLWRQAKAKVLARRGEHAEAEQVAREAVAIGDGGDALNLQADAYADLAEVLLLAGKPDGAAAALEQALDRYGRKGNLVSAQRTRERLSGLSRTGATAR